MERIRSLSSCQKLSSHCAYINPKTTLASVPPKLCGTPKLSRWIVPERASFSAFESRAGRRTSCVAGGRLICALASAHASKRKSGARGRARVKTGFEWCREKNLGIKSDLHLGLFLFLLSDQFDQAVGQRPPPADQVVTAVIFRVNDRIALGHENVAPPAVLQDHIDWNPLLQHSNLHEETQRQWARFCELPCQPAAVREEVSLEGVRALLPAVEVPE